MPLPLIFLCFFFYVRCPHSPGSNGSGKINVMDAICFVLGLSAKTLRGDKLKDLICSTPGSGPGGVGVAKTASVTLVYECNESDAARTVGEILKFSRSINTSGASVYRINDTELTWDSYESVLESIVIKPKARNFLIFQGDVETVAQKNPRDMLKHFEIVCGSYDLK